jgi:phosphatidylethanolamine/phosphatidyl-N-methylethanolamine N-methyltransferase
MQQEWADYRVFWREFRQTFHTTGAVLPSGRALSRALARYVRDGIPPLPPGENRSETNFVRTAAPPSPPATAEGSGRRILEVGPGTGAVTAHIVRNLRQGDHLTLVERNDRFVARLRDRIAGDEAFRPLAGRIELVHAGVEQLPEDRPFDVIVSGLPLNNFPALLVEQIAAKLRRLLAAGGTLSFFEYVAVRKVKAAVSRRDERERLMRIGRVLNKMLRNCEIKRDLVLNNVPPAWVHHVRKGDWGLGAGGDTDQ